MSMITGCPACGTMFKVVPDQLKISEGWVRCGHCEQVFDASVHLQGDDAVLATEPRFAVPASGPGRADPADPPKLAEQPDAGQLPAPAEFLRSATTTAPGEHSPASTPVALAAETPAETQPVAPGYLRAQAAEEPGYPPIDFVRSDDEEERLPVVKRGRAAVDEDDGLEDLTFVRDARRKEFWQRTSVRLSLVLASVALLAMLALQYAVHHRDRLAAVKPQLRPWLERLCRPPGCAIAAPRRIEAIVIENSGFTRLRPDTFRLSFTLKNQAPQPVAVPALELTLTDTQDQALVRRVLTPREMGAPADTIAAASEWSAQLALALEANDSTARISGYRLLAFYP
jgi:predicted Zn finger-like uncharacterized protein